MGYPYRCSDKRNCGRRKSLRHPMEWYIRKPKCPGCKKDTLKFDAARIRTRRKETCYCRGLHYPHRLGTIISIDEYCHEGNTMIELKCKLDAEEMGGTITTMKPTDDCPF